MQDRIGQQLGNYRLNQLLGQGSWASVYLGEHHHLDTQAAIKVLHSQLSESEVESFLTEARTLAHLRHPHIVRVLDFGVQENAPFLVMEYAPGGTLRKRHPKGTRLLLQTVVSYVKQVASALQYAHKQRLIHRDLKPENLLLGPDEEIWLSDFGLAVVIHSARSLPFQPVAGSLAYMAPEQLQGYPTPASDQYALGVLVYEWLAGSRPFSGELPELAVKQALAPPPTLSEKVPTLPRGVEQVVRQALAKDPEQRFASVQAFALALEAAWGGDTSGQTLPILVSADVTQAGHVVVSRPDLPTGTVTLLFSDMEGSTSLLQRLGERYSQVLGEYRQLLRTAFHRWHGYEVDTQGDSFFVAFARATDAVSAAVEAQRTLKRHAWPDGVTLCVRMGLHTGEPQRSAEGYVGLVVHHAARIMSAGHGGQVLLSQTTRDLVEHDLPEGVSLRDVGTHRLKDLQQKSHLYQLAIAGLPTDFPPLKTLDTHPHNLPVQPIPLIGREQEVTLVHNLLRREEVRLLTLTGPGGTGKTRLGLQVAAELSDLFADGIYFVNLAPISDPALVIPAIADTLGIREALGQSLLERLGENLRQQHMLLLLDNFEQVVSAAEQVAVLLVACPQLKVLVTSREVLHLRAEHEFSVPPLALPDLNHLPDVAALAHYSAVALFLQRAQAVRPDIQMTDANARAIAEVCTRLDGLPLAIELAAARMKLLSPQALLARLGQRLAVLTSGARDAPTRQQTLRNTLDWSYRLLDAAEQRLFQRLSVFVGGCTLEAVEAVSSWIGDEESSVFDGVASLLDKSLLQQREQAQGEPRVEMLETLREYGLEALEMSGEMEAIRKYHAEYYLELAEEAEPLLKGAQYGIWMTRLACEQENLRAAFSWFMEHNEVDQALRLGGSLWYFWFQHGDWSEGRRWLEVTLRLTSAQGSTAERAKALYGAGELAYWQDDYLAARPFLEESIALYRALGDGRGLASPLGRLGVFWQQEGNLAMGDPLTEESIALCRTLENTWVLCYLLPDLGWAEELQGNVTKAEAIYQECLTLARELGNKSLIANALRPLGSLAFQKGDPTQAVALLQESLTLAREVNDKNRIAMVAMALGDVALSQGDLTQAIAHFSEGFSLSQQLGDKMKIAYHLLGLAKVAAAEGQSRRAARLFGTAETLFDLRDMHLNSIERAAYEQAVAAAHAQLGEQAFAAAWAEGRAMSPEQAQALATQGQVALPTPGELPSSPTTACPPIYPAGLTAREVEVLRLVATGLTDAQVAEQLVISPRTVNGHLRSIYSKINVTSRSAATRYAVDQHLI
jgi:predicted ATPase/class 3 adenylate cyclase/DNA-binding CsgD family transcriptional regulator/predicted Ser/Thr protein kinase